MHALKTSRSSSSETSTAGLAVLKEDALAHGALFTILLIILRIAFYKDSFLMVLRFAASLYWLFILPGTTLLLAWGKRWGFAERAAVGTAAALSIVGTASYYLAIAGLPVRYHHLIFTPALIGISIAVMAYRSRRR